MRLLIAEDDSASRRLLQATLSRWDHDVVSVADGEAAWQMLQREDAPQLAILDWMMPGIDGIEVCRRMRARPHPRSIYIILLTTKGKAPDIIAGLQAGADDYVTKPFDRQELRARIQVGVRTLELQKSLAAQAKDRGVARALIEERERFAAAVAEMSEGIVVLDEDFRITTANRAACLLLNLSNGHWPGTCLDDSLRPFTVSVAVDELRCGREQSTAFEIARAYTLPPLFLEARLSRLFEPSGRFSGAVLTLRDVTTQRHDQNVRANFLMMVSHKLRTPLMVISGYLYLCRRLSPAQMVEHWPRILDVYSKEVEELQEMVKRLLDLKALSTRQMETEAQQTDIAPVITAALEEVRGRYPQNHIDVRVEIAPGATHTSASVEHLGLVLEKLTDNVVKFADQEHVRIAIRVERKDPAWLKFSVADNGPGIPHEYHDRVFDGFVQIEDHVTGQVPGLGIGLFMARQVVKAYEGSIWIQSVIGEGSTVEFTLPP